MLGLTAVASPPNEGVCDELVGTTPGLYGLCVAFCETQDCEATYDPATDTVAFDENCRPSSPKLLDNFNKRGGVGGPHMPCVNITENECDCWTEAELDLIPTNGSTRCAATSTNNPTLAQLYTQIDLLTVDVANTLSNDGGATFTCSFNGVVLGGGRDVRLLQISADEHATCVASIEAECFDRGF